jgi:hypothetical protein
MWHAKTRSGTMDTKYQVHLRRPQRLRGTTGGCKMESQEGARSSYHEQHQDGSLQALPGGRHRTATRLPGGQHRTATHHTTHPKELILLCTRHTPVRLLSPQHWAQTCTESRIALQQVEGDGYADVRKGYAQEDQNCHGLPFRSSPRLLITRIQFLLSAWPWSACESYRMLVESVFLAGLAGNVAMTVTAAADVQPLFDAACQPLVELAKVAEGFLVPIPE